MPLKRAIHIYSNCWIALIISLSLSGTANAQSGNVQPSPMGLSFDVVNNHYNSFKALAELKIKPSIDLPPGKGWGLFFNSKNMLTLPDTSAGLILKKQQGNLFKISSNDRFKGIKKGQEFKVDIVLDNSIVNRNDLPEGFYMVWDDPTTATPVTDLKLSASYLDQAKTSDFAATVYYRNERIDRALPAGMKVFPSAKKEELTGGSFNSKQVRDIKTPELYANEGWLLKRSLQQLTGLTIASSNGSNLIEFETDKLLAPEAYSLNISKEKALIKGADARGIFYGAQSLLSLIAFESGRAQTSIACRIVEDIPRFSYRGFMQDVARNFQTKEEVLRILDLLALYKLNTFHFHLTDDEGWRIEIDGLPELTAIGSNRGNTITEHDNLAPAYGSGAMPKTLYGSGFYTNKDLIEILQYAKARHINVIPEIETPGHARAAIKAMDARYEHYMKAGNRAEALKYFLRDTLDTSFYTTPQWYHDNVVNVALPSVYTFVEKVVSGIQQTYADAGVELKTIHVGGDEVPAGVWEKSPMCQALIKQQPGIEDVNGLWYYYLSKVHTILETKGIGMAGWEEIGLRKTSLDGKPITIPNPDFTAFKNKLFVWNNTFGNEDLAYKLANAGYPVVLVFVSNYYFDMMNYNTYSEPGYNWGGITDIEKSFEFIPFDYLRNSGNNIKRDIPLTRLTEYGKQNIIGMQGALWSETLKGPAQLEYMLLPRLLALAERSWAADPGWSNETDSLKFKSGYNTSWSSFVSGMGNAQLPLLDKLNGGYQYRIPPAGAIMEEGMIKANTQFPNTVIHFTQDGTEPTIQSPVYSQPLRAGKLTKFKVFNQQGRGSYTTVVSKL